MTTFACSTTTCVVLRGGGLTAEAAAAAASILLEGGAGEDSADRGDGACGACVMDAVTHPCTHSRSCEL